MALSDDLRKRVVEAVTDGGMSQTRRRSVSGSVSPAPSVGCTASRPQARFRRLPRAGIAARRIEAHRDYLLGLIRRQPDTTLLEIQERLIANCGERFSSSVIWRFFDRRDHSKKSRDAEEPGFRREAQRG